MNSPPSRKLDIDEFHIERSKCLDAFAQLETAVIVLLGLTGHVCRGEHFGQKLELLKNAKASPKLSKARIACIREAVIRCEALSGLRNDIVHSTLQISVIDEVSKACFINSRYCQSGSQTARLFSIQGLRDMASELRGLSETLTTSKLMNSNPGSNQHK